MLNMLEEAVKLAVENHAGVKDKQGKPYVLHPLRVMQSVAHYGDDVAAVAVMHDLVEDTEVGLDGLLRFGFPEHVVEAVDALTRRWLPDEVGVTKRRKESYEDFIERVAKNPIAVVVKLADLRDNMDPSRTLLDAEVPARLAKYARAYARLLPLTKRCLVCNGRGSVPMKNVFEREEAAYERELERMLSLYPEGSGVLVKDDEVIGVFKDEHEAMREGYERFGTNTGKPDTRREPFMMRRLERERRVVMLPGYFGPPPGDPCPAGCKENDHAA